MPEPGMGANNDHGSSGGAGLGSDRGDNRGGAAEKESFDSARDSAKAADKAAGPPGIGAPPSSSTSSHATDKDDRDTAATTGTKDRAAGPPGIGAPPSDSTAPDTTDKDDRAVAAASSTNGRAAGPPGIGAPPSAGPMSGNDSLNSQRGYGPDDASLAGGIDQAVNAGLAAKAETKTIDIDALDQRIDEDKAGQTGYDFATPAATAAATANGTIDAAAAFSDKFSPDIAKGLKTASAIAGPGGRVIGSGAETIEAVMNAKPGDKAKAGATGFVASLDDIAVGAAGGFVGGIAGSSFPGPGTALGAAAGSTTASITYDNSPIDKAIDRGVNFVSDKIEDGLDFVADNVDRFEKSLIDRAIGDVARRAQRR